MAKIRVGELVFYYEQLGQGEPLLLLHGLGSSTQDWQMQMEPFARQRRVIALDLRGHGRSAKPPGPYSIPMFAGDVSAFMHTLNLPPAHVVGLSLGGMIAFQLTLDTPELVRSLTIVNSVPKLVPRTLADKWPLWRRAAIVEVMGMRRMGVFLAARLFPKPEQREWREMMAARWPGPTMWGWIPCWA